MSYPAERTMTKTAPATAKPMKEKKTKEPKEKKPKEKAPAPAPAVEGEKAAAAKKAGPNISIGRKCRRLRGKAIHAGFTEGKDQMKALITKKQVLKMLKFVPKRSAEAGGFEKDEFDERFLTAQEKFSTGACEVLAPRIESLFRALVSEGMQRAHEYGKSSIDVTTMASVLRPYAKSTLFDTEKPPPGIIGHAFNKGILNPTEVDDENEAEMTAEGKRQQAAEDDAQAKRDKLAAERSAKYKASGRKPGFAKAK